MNETLKGIAHIGAELAAAKADLQREMERHRKTWRHLDSLRDVAREALAVIERLRPEGNGMGTIVRLKAALSLQAEPAPAQDERTAFEAWVMQHNTAVREDYDDTDENAPEDIRLDRQGGVYIWANAEAAWFAWKARSALDTRPAQTEQQPVAAQQILDLIMEECRYWHGRDEARRGNFANLYAAAKELADNTAPIAQTAPQTAPDFRPQLSALVKACQQYLDADGAECFPEDALLDATVALERDAHAASVRDTHSPATATSHE